MSRPEFEWGEDRPVNLSWVCRAYGGFVGRVYKRLRHGVRRWYLSPNFEYLGRRWFATRRLAQDKLEELFVEREVERAVRALERAGESGEDAASRWVHHSGFGYTVSKRGP